MGKADINHMAANLIDRRAFPPKEQQTSKHPVYHRSIHD
jgi:hypothetical protein